MKKNKIIYILPIMALIIISIFWQNNNGVNNDSNSLIGLQNAQAGGISEWWNSKTHDCVDDCGCMEAVLFQMAADGTWTQGSGGFGFEVAELNLAGTRTECTSGDSVAHCWDCTEMVCVVPNDVILDALSELNN